MLAVMCATARLSVDSNTKVNLNVLLGWRCKAALHVVRLWQKNDKRIECISEEISSRSMLQKKPH